ncbi:hypothetical protein GCM10020254_46050 [Streptomyces goshikiensis]
MGRVRETEPGGEDEFVVLDLGGAGALLVGGEGGDGGGPFGVVDAAGLADDDAALVEEPAQRDHHVAGEIEPAAASGRKGWYVM